MPLPTPLTDEQHPQRPATAARHAVARMRTARPAHSDRRRRETSRMRTRTCDVLRTRHRTAVQQRRCAQQSLARGRRRGETTRALSRLVEHGGARALSTHVARRYACPQAPTASGAVCARTAAKRAGTVAHCPLPPVRACTAMCNAWRMRTALFCHGEARALPVPSAGQHARLHAPPSGPRLRACAPLRRFSAHAHILLSRPARPRLRAPHTFHRAAVRMRSADSSRWFRSPAVILLGKKKEKREKKNTEKTKLNTTPAHHISHSRGKWISQ